MVRHENWLSTGQVFLKFRPLLQSHGIVKFRLDAYQNHSCQSSCHDTLLPLLSQSLACPKENLFTNIPLSKLGLNRDNWVSYNRSTVYQSSLESKGTIFGIQMPWQSQWFSLGNGSYGNSCMRLRSTALSVAFYMAQAPHYAESCCTFLFCVFNQLEDRLAILVIPMTLPHVQALHQSLSKKLIHALFEDCSQYIHNAPPASFSFSNLVGTFCKKLE